MSVFGIMDNAAGQDGIFLAVGEGDGSKFDYFKVRMYGRLHFAKRLKNQYTSDPIMRTALNKEFETGYALDHPNVVRYLSYRDFTIYQEYIDGETLAQAMAAGSEYLKNPANLTDIASALLDALGYLHTNGVLHLDLKPSNIMLTRVGHQLKLIDLGGCQTAMNDNTPEYTPGYESPEQLTQTRFACATDIYHVGCVMKELAEYCGCEKQWRKFVERAMNPDLDARYSGVEEAKKGLPSRKGGGRKALLILTPLVVLTALGYFLFFTHTPAQEVSTPAPVAEVDTVAAAEGAQPIAEKTENADRIVAEPVAPAPLPVSENVQSPSDANEALLKEIKKELGGKISGFYKTELFPLFDSYNDDEEAAEQQIRGKIAELIDRSIELSHDYENRYPQFSQEIHACAASIIDENQNTAGYLYKKMRSEKDK